MKAIGAFSSVVDTKVLRPKCFNNLCANPTSFVVSGSSLYAETALFFAGISFSEKRSATRLVNRRSLMKSS